VSLKREYVRGSWSRREVERRVQNVLVRSTAAILRILDEEVFRPEALGKFEERLRRQLAPKRATPIEDGIAPVKRREQDLQRQIADGARRMLLVDPSLVPDLNAALAELKVELTRVQRDLESKRRAASVTEDGVRPIRVHIDLGTPPGWRKALKRVQVRHISFADPQPDQDASGFVVSPAVAAKAERAAAGGWEATHDPPTWERELVPSDLEEVRELVGATG
jgi:hypothetical protein